MEREVQYFEQFGETIQDEYGGLYSSDGVWLLSAPTGRHKTCRIKEGTQIIAHYAFMGRFDGDMYIDSCNNRGADFIKAKHKRLRLSVFSIYSEAFDVA